jgi:N-acetylmuramoyl-L-alanine amidase/Secretion system C-terminal sorting domain/Fibronectin type III domain
MKKYTLNLAFFFITIYVHAQSIEPDRAVVDITQFSSGELMGIHQSVNGIRSAQQEDAAVFIRHDIDVPLSDLTSFLAFSIVWEAQNWDIGHNQLWVRFKGADASSEWQILNVDIHADKSGNKLISELTFADEKVKKLDIKIVFGKGSEALVQNLKLHFYNPGNVNKKANTASTTAADTRAVCTCPQPDFQTRAEWCPTGDCPENPNPSTTTVTHLIVHHSAGVNSSSDWAAVVRSIWDYHVNVNGWSDIGYNYLVDPNGVLYEGRGDNILGAHFCGTNAGTMGVCMMGDFTNITPTNSARTMLKNLLVWKICDIDADPEGSAFHASSNLTLNNISGHQDGCATACPGASFYPQLPAIRAEVSQQINNDCALENLAAPTNLTAEVLSATSVKLQWQDNSTNENNFIIQRSVSNNSNFVLVGNVSENVTTYTDNNLQANTAYFYQVRAENAANVSDFSNQVGIATVITATKNIGNLSMEVYPNPMADWLFIDVSDNDKKEITIQIFEMGTSKRIRSYTAFANGTTIKQDVSDLPKGLYFLQVSNGLQEGFMKLVKQ